jgi:acyl transferase domain-containing protein/NAD(P)-dependent dehydrogenase (short-subunit alcohol dehydrogenase family)
MTIPEETANSDATTAVADTDVAVIGMDCRFPGAANPTQYWENLIRNVSSVQQIPASRWDVRTCFGDPRGTNKTNSKWGGLIEDIDKFDAGFFHISPVEAQLMDPQQRLMLELCWGCLEDAGYPPASLSGSDTGVFIGVTNLDYKELLEKSLPSVEAHRLTGNHQALIANRVSYFLNLRGPSMPCDTACSSSLFALHQAIQSINRGECGLAFVGGVNALLTPTNYISCAKTGMLSPTGQCRTFDSDADGYVRGEGGGVVLLKALKKALADGDNIHGIIKGSAVNHNGRSKTITSPNAFAQSLVIQEAYSKARVSPDWVTYIEAHGTGTPAGDPMEINGLKRAWKSLSRHFGVKLEDGVCGIGSHKTNIGHLESAAGIAGIIKVLLAFKQRKLPGLANFKRINPSINLDGSPFYLVTEEREWRAGSSSASNEPLFAGVSSFGFGGTNAHVVLQSSPVRAASEAAAPEYLCVLSARNKAQLLGRARQLLSLLSNDGCGYSLSDITYTLRTGREPMQERLALVVTTKEQLEINLQAFCDEHLDAVSGHHGNVEAIPAATRGLLKQKQQETLLRVALQERDLGLLGYLWVSGVEIDWGALHGAELPRRISLPTYPFAKNRHWIGMDDATLPLDASEAESISAQLTTNPIAASAWDQISYVSRWEEQTLPPHSGASNAGITLVVACGPALQLDRTILSYYQSHGARHVRLLRAADRTEQLSADEWLYDARDAESFRHCLRSMEKIDTVHFLAMTEQESPSLGLRELPSGYDSCEVSLLQLIACLKQDQRIEEQVDCYLLTLDNHGIDQPSNRCLGSGVAGLGYALAQGSYRFRVRNIDLSSIDLRQPQDRAATVESILRESPSDRGEVIKLRSGKRYRCVFHQLHWDAPAASVIKHNGVYLIVGGAGTVGQVFTRGLIEKYQASVVWIGRSAVTSQAVQSALRSFGEHQHRICYIEADVTDPQRMLEAIGAIKQRYHAIHGAIFAGMSWGHDSFIDTLTESEFRASTEVKMRGSLVLYRALEQEPLDFLCYFSSGQAYSFSGAARFPGYAAGITFADRLVESIHADSAFPVGVINWGFWKSSVEKMRQRLAGVSTVHLDALDEQEGFECFERFLNELQRRRIRQVLCMKVSPEVQPLLNRGPEAYIAATGMWVKTEPEAAASRPRARQPSRAGTSAGISQYVEDCILECLVSTSKLSRQDVDRNAPFSEYGIDSILAVSFIERLNRRLDLSLNTAVLFEYATVNLLTRHVTNVHGAQVQSQLATDADDVSACTADAEHEVRMLTHDRPTAATQVDPQGHANVSDIAVIGMSGMFPKANDVHEFWENLRNGVDGVEELPSHYLDRRYFSSVKQAGKTRCKWGGTLRERDCFDPLFFRIAPSEAEAMNPHQRLVMQEGWKAIEDAGYNPKALGGTPTGVFIGAEPTQYRGESFTGFSDAIIASRLSYVLNLTGPAFVVNTGCSASAVAIHLACESLRNRETNLALAGGVQACMDQSVQIALDQIEMLSPTGRCATFDSSGDGTVISEGIGMVVLKRLDDAIAAGDHIYGVICGSGTNQDGASNGITAPNGAAQESLIASVYERFGINPEHISYVEAHGTGTKLGDPVEANALVRAFRRFTDKTKYCALGSTKAHVGHTAAAAGVTGLIRVLLSLKHEQIPPLLHLRQLNPLIELDGSPFYIAAKPSDWRATSDAPRMAVLNSFGHSGTNAHVVIKELWPARDAERPASASQSVLILLSAKTAAQLRLQAANLLGHIQAHPAHQPIDLARMAYTLQVGREAMQERVGFIVDSVEQLVEKLQAFIDRQQAAEAPLIDGIHASKGRGSKELVALFSTEPEMQETLARWMHQRKLSKLVDLWVKGVELDWSQLYHDEQAQPRRMSLPSYPFARERYWTKVDRNVERTMPESGRESPALLHPLIHENCSDFFTPCFRSTFTGEEFFLKDHRIKGDKVLPGVAYLEMAREAVGRTLGSTVTEPVEICLKNVAWLRPIVVNSAQTVKTSLSLGRTDAKSFQELLERNPSGIEIPFIIALENSSAPSVACCEGVAVVRLASGRAESSRPDVRELLTRFNAASQNVLEGSQCYRTLARRGYEFGPSFNGIQKVFCSTDTQRPTEVLAEIKLPAEAADCRSEFVLHPGVLDSAIQAAIGLEGVDSSSEARNADSAQPALPFAIDSVEILRPCTDALRVWIRHADTRKGSMKLDLDLFNDDAAVCVRIKGYCARVPGAARAGSDARAGEETSVPLLFKPVWRDITSSAPHASSDAGPVYSDHKIFLCGFDGLYGELSKRVRAGSTCIALESAGQAPVACFASHATRLFEHIKAALKAKPTGRVLFQVVAPASGPGQLFSALSAMFLTASQESARFFGQVILVDHNSSVDGILAAIEAGCRYSETAKLRYVTTAGSAGTCLVSAFEEISSTPASASRPWKRGGVYLITGGLGGLGLLFAREIARRQAEAVELADINVILVGRSKLSKQGQQAFDELAALGISVHYRSVDVADGKAVQNLVGEIRATFGRLDGIIHGAGLIRDSFILYKNKQEFSTVLAPKVEGLIHLEQATRDLDLDFLVLFSSTSGALGNVGQIDYAAANAFMDAFAHAEHSQPRTGRRRVLSINWPLWREGGMTVDAATMHAGEERTGMVAMETATGIQAFYRALSSSECQVMVVDGDAAKIRRTLTAQSRAAAIQAQAPMHRHSAVQEVIEDAQNVFVTDADLEAEARKYLKGKLNTVLKVPAVKIDAATSFTEYGMDSITALDLIRALEADLGSVTKTLFFEYENIDELSAYLVKDYRAKLVELFKPQHCAPTQPSDPVVAQCSTSPVDSTAGYQIVEKRDLVAGSKLAQLINEIRGNDYRDGALLDMLPYLFVSADSRGFYHFLEDNAFIFATRFCGPEDESHRAESAVMERLLQYCRQNGHELCYLDTSGSRKLLLEQTHGLVSTSVGVIQTIRDLQSFTIEGSKMRRLRYAIGQFRQSGTCRTAEYSGGDEVINRKIKDVIDEWSRKKQVVNNVAATLADIDSGELCRRYRVFLTYVNDLLQNVILISRISGGYLMDQEYYVPEIAAGGTEFATVEIIKQLASEGHREFSLGLTWGLIEPPQGFSDSSGWRLVNEAKGQLARMFEGGAKNHQYKSKYRPLEMPVYIYRLENSRPGLVIQCMSQFFKNGISYQEVHSLVENNAVPANATDIPDEHFDVTQLDPRNLHLDLISDSWLHLNYGFIHQRASKLRGNG